MIKLSILALSATLMTAPAFAQSNAYYSPNQSVDLSVVFDNTENLQVAVLSQKEMQETEGARALNIAQIGGGGGFGARLNNHFGSLNFGGGLGKFSATTTAIGGASGAFGGAMSYTDNVPFEKRTSEGYAVAVGTGFVGGAVTTLPIGRVRASVMGVGMMMAGNDIASRRPISREIP